MRRTDLNSHKYHWGNISAFLALTFLLMAAFPTRSAAQQQGQKTFASAEEASQSLFAAAQSNDTKALLEILGPDGKEIVNSGDDNEDAQSRSMFVQHYQEMHRLVKEPDGSVTLYIGAANWPCPIPIVNKGSIWYFDTDAGKKEILYRRVGRNEMSAIHVLQQLVVAQKEYFSSQHNEYAQKLFSDEGKHDGLYWKAAPGEPESPIGPQVAKAVAHGYANIEDTDRIPFRGYFFHVVTRQGKVAPGGAKNYIVNGKMTDGFAFIAYPAEYRSSGVMTFMVGPDGVVYQKDLGKKSIFKALAIKEFNPDAKWAKAIEEPTQTAGEKPAK